jgi:soluble lytic murein transglycosylase-like protein
MGSFGRRKPAMTGTRFAFRTTFAAPFALAVLTLAAASAQDQIASQPDRALPGAPEPHAPSAPAAHAGPVARWRPFIAEASRRFGIPAVWIERVMRAESGGRARLNGRPITSPAGAMGLMQLMPATWADLRARYGLGPDPFDPHDNILAGAAFLAELRARFGYPGLLGAYNAGPARYADWLAGRRALPAETAIYLARIRGEDALDGSADGAAQGPAGASKSSARESLFAIDRAIADGSPAHEKSLEGGLFVRLANRLSGPVGD